MPVTRKKSCIQCRQAKARCNLAATCSRCADRLLKCNYGGVLPAPGDLTNPNSRRISSDVGSVARETGQSHLSQPEERDLLDPMLTNQADAMPPAETYRQNPTTLGMDAVEWPSRAFQSAEPSGLLSGCLNLGVLSDFSEMRNHFPSQSHETSPVRPDRIQQQFSLVQDTENHPSQCQTSVLGDTPVAWYDQLYYNTPSRTPVTNQTILLAHVLWGQIKAYPRMIIQGQLPPFIYPVCIINDVLPTNCVMNGIHQCLPDSLTACANLVGMFVRRTPASSSFIWKSISSEVQKLKKEHRMYGNDNQLGALQSITIYILLWAEDTQSKNKSDMGTLVATLLAIATHLTQSNDHTQNVYENKNLTHREWSFIESLRRTISLSYMLGSLLGAIIGNDNSGPCAGFDPLILPCPRLLWDYQSNESWAYRLNAFKTAGMSQKMLTLWDLKTVKGSELAATPVDEPLVEAMARWCQGLDEFGSLLWMGGLLM